MTVRARFVVTGITDRGPNSPKVVMLSAKYDGTIPQDARLQKSTAAGVISLSTDNPSVLAQVQIGSEFQLDFTPADSAPALTPPPPAPQTQIAVADWPDTLLQVGTAFVFEDVWNAVGLTRGTYTDINGTTYEMHIGVAQSVGPNGEMSARFVWKFPTGTTEVKAYPSFVVGNQPGWANTWTNPGGYPIRLPDGTTSTAYPSGKTPNSIFPLALPLTSLNSVIDYSHNATSTGRSQLTYDIWLQNSPTQAPGFNANNELVAEIMIPLDYSAGYGAYVAGGGGRNPSWYVKDDTIDGRLWHIYHATPAQFGSVQHFVVFEPDAPGLQPGTLNLAAFVNYAVAAGWAPGATHCVSVGLGVEAIDGTGDLTVNSLNVTQ